MSNKQTGGGASLPTHSVSPSQAPPNKWSIPSPTPFNNAAPPSSVPSSNTSKKRPQDPPQAPPSKVPKSGSGPPTSPTPINGQVKVIDAPEFQNPSVLESETVMDVVYRSLKDICPERSLAIARILGGREVWLQVELASRIVQDTSGLFSVLANPENPDGWIVQREKTVWATSNKGDREGKCDIWLQPERPEDPIYCFEFKVEYSTPTGQVRKNNSAAGDKPGDPMYKNNSVATRFIDDIKKSQGAFSTDVSQETAKYNVKRICMAITANPKDLEASDDWIKAQAAFGKSINYTWLEEPMKGAGGNMTKGTALIWWAKPDVHGTPKL